MKLNRRDMIGGALAASAVAVLAVPLKASPKRLLTAVDGIPVVPPQEIAGWKPIDVKAWKRIMVKCTLEDGEWKFTTTPLDGGGANGEKTTP